MKCKSVSHKFSGIAIEISESSASSSTNLEKLSRSGSKLRPRKFGDSASAVFAENFKIAKVKKTYFCKFPKNFANLSIFSNFSYRVTFFNYFICFCSDVNNLINPQEAATKKDLTAVHWESKTVNRCTNRAKTGIEPGYFSICVSSPFSLLSIKDKDSATSVS